MAATYDAIGFDLLTALLDTWSLFGSVAGDDGVGRRWHRASQARLRGRPYRAYEEILREAAIEVGLSEGHASEVVSRWGEIRPWPDVPEVLPRLTPYRRFVVTNCSERLGQRAAANVGAPFELIMTAEVAGAYKPDPRPYRAALERLGLEPRRVLFVAGSDHDVGGASRLGMPVYWANRGSAAPPTDASALREEPDLRALPDVLALGASA